MIKAEKIIKIYKTGGGDLRVLKGVDLEVKTGEFISVIGRSGSGKSTLLYQLGLLDRPTSGDIYIDNINVSKLPDKIRTKIRLNDLGYVFQDYALVPELTALENVAVPLLMKGLPYNKAEEKSLEVLDRVGLGARAGNTPNKLSGGEQQRVSIARAIAHNPKIIFADEPTANLDNETSLSVMELFSKLHKEGQTIIMVTHEPEYAKMTDRVVCLFDGIIKSDRPSNFAF